jgi:hydrogenase maturation factor
MNIVSGEIREIYAQEGMTMAKVKVKGAYLHAPVLFLPEAIVGDTVLVESGVIISKVEEHPQEERKHVPRNPG